MKQWIKRRTAAWRQHLRTRRITKLRETIDEMTCTIEWAAACRNQCEHDLRVELIATQEARP